VRWCSSFADGRSPCRSCGHPRSSRSIRGSPARRSRICYGSHCRGWSRRRSGKPEGPSGPEARDCGHRLPLGLRWLESRAGAGLPTCRRGLSSERYAPSGRASFRSQQRTLRSSLVAIPNNQARGLASPRKPLSPWVPLSRICCVRSSASRSPTVRVRKRTSEPRSSSEKGSRIRDSRVAGLDIHAYNRVDEYNRLRGPDARRRSVLQGPVR
jgi:hypothetical protein